MEIPLLPLQNMDERHKGLLPSTAANYLDAARVCLDRYYVPPQEFDVLNDAVKCQVMADWQTTDERCRDAWANQDDATRDGAYACALATVELLRGFVAIRRAETRTGADYYVAPVGQILEDLEGCFRLEVSGTDLSVSEVKRRVRDKINQTVQGNSNLPALVCVVGFRTRLIMIQTAA
jgi:hypothetical protein